MAPPKSTNLRGISCLVFLSGGTPGGFNEAWDKLEVTEFAMKVLFHPRGPLMRHKQPFMVIRAARYAIDFFEKTMAFLGGAEWEPRFYTLLLRAMALIDFVNEQIYVIRGY